MTSTYNDESHSLPVNESHFDLPRWHQRRCGTNQLFGLQSLPSKSKPDNSILQHLWSVHTLLNHEITSPLLPSSRLLPVVKQCRLSAADVVRHLPVHRHNISQPNAIDFLFARWHHRRQHAAPSRTLSLPAKTLIAKMSSTDGKKRVTSQRSVYYLEILLTDTKLPEDGHVSHALCMLSVHIPQQTSFLFSSVTLNRH